MSGTAAQREKQRKEGKKGPLEITSHHTANGEKPLRFFLCTDTRHHTPTRGLELEHRHGTARYCAIHSPFKQSRGDQRRGNERKPHLLLPPPPPLPYNVRHKHPTLAAGLADTRAARRPRILRDRLCALTRYRVPPARPLWRQGTPARRRDPRSLQSPPVPVSTPALRVRAVAPARL